MNSNLAGPTSVNSRVLTSRVCTWHTVQSSARSYWSHSKPAPCKQALGTHALTDVAPRKTTQRVSSSQRQTDSDTFCVCLTLESCFQVSWNCTKLLNWSMDLWNLYLSLCLFVYLCISLPPPISICFSVLLSLSVRLCLSVSLSVFLYLCSFLSV